MKQVKRVERSSELTIDLIPSQMDFHRCQKWPIPSSKERFPLTIYFCSLIKPLS
jgi:hypothetical protein